MESVIEQKFRDDCIAQNWDCVKYSNPSKTGAPDRLVLTNVGVPVFVECKQKNEKPRVEQYRYMIDLMERGYLCLVHRGEVDTIATIKAFESMPSSERSMLVYKQLLNFRNKFKELKFRLTNW